MCDALPAMRKMILLDVFVIFLFIKCVVVSVFVRRCTVAVLMKKKVINPD